MAARFLCVLLLLAGRASACGKKGPPLAPLYLVPSAVTEISARRIEGTVRIRFALPSRNENGPGIDLDRIEVFAVTVPAGGETPPNRELLTKDYLAGQIAVKPAPVEGAPATSAPADTRPAPGEIATFVEQIPPMAVGVRTNTRKVKPPAPSKGAPATLLPPVTPPVVEGIKVAQSLRVYVIRGVARNGRSGPASARVQVPLGDAPEPPGGIRVRNTEKSVVVDWLPAVAALGAAAPAYNVYRQGGSDEPLNPKPIAEISYEQAGAERGTEVCYGVRSVDVAGSVLLESEMSGPACVIPKDVFPPATPKGLAAVAAPDGVQLVWDANTEPDLAGYIVLRAGSPDETLQPLTPLPIRDTVYRDTAVTAGASYWYAIVAVDSASPANSSPPSERVPVVVR
jgi:predicted small lipoprotein YifL